MSEEDADALQNAYGYYLQDDGVLKLRSDLTDAERTALEEAVTTPDIVLYMAAAQNANATAGDEAEAMTAAPTAEDLDAVCAQFAAMAQTPGFSREMIQQQLASAMEQVDETTLSSWQVRPPCWSAWNMRHRAFPMMYRWPTSSGWAARCWP